MCVNQRYIVNPYTRKGLYVNCGKCPSCLQEKAIHRVRRIKNTYSDALECMMVSLTYKRGSVPYIDRSEAYNFSHGRLPYLNVYRDSLHRRIRKDSSYDFSYSCKNEKVNLERVDFGFECDFSRLKDLKYENGKIGVCYYPDVQHFVARLRLNLKRLYSYDTPFKTFCCSEYGSKSLRPHFHLLLFYNKGDYETLRSAIIKSWPFSNLQNFPRAIEKCFRGASYVASYVNSGSRFPPFLKSYFAPKHSYSKGFGLGNRFFNLRYILDAYKRGSLSYNCIKTDGICSDVRSVLIPKYVIHRYFPKFTGYSRIAPTALYDNLRRLANGSFDEYNKSVAPLYLSDVDCKKVHIRLNNAVKRCLDEYPEFFGDSPFEEYYRLHIKIWNLYNSCVLRYNMENDNLFLFEKYDNLDVVKEKINRRFLSDKFRSDKRFFPIGFSEHDLDLTDVNSYPHNVVRTNYLVDCFNTNQKHRMVSNTVASQLNEEW